MNAHHRLNVHELEQIPGDSEGQGSLACCSPLVTRSWTWLSNWTTTFIGMTDAEAEVQILWPPDSLEKALMLDKIEGRRKRGWQKASWLDSITNSIDINLIKLQGMMKEREAWLAVWLSDWAATISKYITEFLLAYVPLFWKSSFTYLMTWEMAT